MASECPGAHLHFLPGIVGRHRATMLRGGHVSPRGPGGSRLGSRDVYTQKDATTGSAFDSGLKAVSSALGMRLFSLLVTPKIGSVSLLKTGGGGSLRCVEWGERRNTVCRATRPPTQILTRHC